MSTRSEALKAECCAAIERRAASIDADQLATAYVVRVKLNEGGHPLMVEFERFDREDVASRARNGLTIRT